MTSIPCGFTRTTWSFPNGERLSTSKKLYYIDSTHIVIPLYPCFELSETEVNLDAEHDRPVCLAVLAMFRLCTSAEG